MPDVNIDQHENYWKLIGNTGTLLSFANEINFPNDDRVLIQFDFDIKAEGLECHNEKPNSLWILKADLEIIET